MEIGTEQEPAPEPLRFGPQSGLIERGTSPWVLRSGHHDLRAHFVADVDAAAAMAAVVQRRRGEPVEPGFFAQGTLDDAITYLEDHWDWAEFVMLETRRGSKLSHRVFATEHADPPGSNDPPPYLRKRRRANDPTGEPGAAFGHAVMFGLTAPPERAPWVCWSVEKRHNESGEIDRYRRRAEDHTDGAYLIDRR